MDSLARNFIFPAPVCGFDLTKTPTTLFGYNPVVIEHKPERFTFLRFIARGGVSRCKMATTYKIQKTRKQSYGFSKHTLTTTLT